MSLSDFHSLAKVKENMHGHTFHCLKERSWTWVMGGATPAIAGWTVARSGAADYLCRQLPLPCLHVNHARNHNMGDPRDTDTLAMLNSIKLRINSSSTSWN